MEDPNLHLSIFLEMCDTLKLNGVSIEAIRLQLFPFSLKDKVKVWLHLLPPGSITTYDELTRAFFIKFFQPSKTTSLRNQIVTFLKRKMRPFMRLGSGSRIYCNYTFTMDSKSR